MMMSVNETEESILQKVRNLLRQGAFQDEVVARRGKVVRPLPVLTSRRELHSWFVGIEVESHLAGFFQFLPDLTLLRTSTFLHGSGDIENCPLASSWTDPNVVRERASLLLQPGETADIPYLSYDKIPDRLAWAVPVTTPDGTKRLIYVAGEYAYAAVEDIGTG